MSYITAIGTAVPNNKFSQSAICSFMERTMDADAGTVRKIRAVFKASGIDQRHSVLSDYGRTSGFTFYPNSADGEYPDTQKRMEQFRMNALALSVASIKDMLTGRNIDMTEVSHLIVVSCTGMYAPGLDIDIIKALKLSTSVQRTCIQFMGCYAAFNALKVANAFCTSDNTAKVLIVCTEICSIHFQHQSSDDNILANALFADGSAAMLVEPTPIAGKTLQLVSFHNELAIKGDRDMAWNIGNSGFEMRLSSYIPELLKSEIQHLIRSLLSKIQMEMKDLRHFAIHPGGKKILETIGNELGLRREDMDPSYTVLRNYGNMSSATVMFVLRKIFNGISKLNQNELILGMGFGPGLTLESMLLKVHVD